MKITDLLKNFFGKKTKYDVLISNLQGEVYFKLLAIQSGINLIANTLSVAEFVTYREGKPHRGENYYLLNVAPNQNQNASKFFRKLVHKLVYDNQCLVIMHRMQFYVADSYTVKEYALKENIYTDVVVGELEFEKVFYESDVFHFEWHNQRMKDIIDALYNSYSKLIEASQKHYKQNNARRGTLAIPTSLSKTEEGQEHIMDLLSNQFKKFYDAEGNAVLPLSRGEEYTEFENKSVKGGIEGRDIRAFVDDVFDYVAMALQIPPQLLKGDVADTDKAVNNFLTFCINPLAELLGDEINRKWYGKTLFTKRTYCKLDTTRVKAVEIKDIANALDVLTRIGAHTVDDNLEALGQEPLGGELGAQRFITKNYMPIEEMLKGGD